MARSPLRIHCTTEDATSESLWSLTAKYGEASSASKIEIDVSGIRTASPSFIDFVSGLTSQATVTLRNVTRVFGLQLKAKRLYLRFQFE